MTQGHADPPRGADRRRAARPDAPVADPDDGAPDAPPPIFGSWGRLYALVLLNLAVLILIFYAFTRAFHRP